MSVVELKCIYSRVRVILFIILNLMLRNFIEAYLERSRTSVEYGGRELP